jgi:hypothetical protein
MHYLSSVYSVTIPLHVSGLLVAHHQEVAMYICDNWFHSNQSHTACDETNLMHYLSSVYSVTIPLHVSGLLVAHHQEVTMYIWENWYVLYVLVDCQLAKMGPLWRPIYIFDHILLSSS